MRGKTLTLEQAVERAEEALETLLWKRDECQAALEELDRRVAMVKMLQKAQEAKPADRRKD